MTLYLENLDCSAEHAIEDLRDRVAHLEAAVCKLAESLALHWSSHAPR